MTDNTQLLDISAIHERMKGIEKSRREAHKEIDREHNDQLKCEVELITYEFWTYQVGTKKNGLFTTKEKAESFMHRVLSVLNSYLQNGLVMHDEDISIKIVKCKYSDLYAGDYPRVMFTGAFYGIDRIDQDPSLDIGERCWCPLP